MKNSGLMETLQKNIQYTIVVDQLDDLDFLQKHFFMNNPIIYDEYKIWWKWDSELMRWIKIDETQIIIDFNRIFELTGKSTFLSNVKSMILNALKVNGRLFKQQYVKEIKDTWVVFKDVIIDVETNEMFDNSYEYFSTNPLNYNYKSSEDTSTPIIDKLLNDWVGNNKNGDWVKTLKQMMAYTMLPSYPIEVTFVLHGSGSNGKSTFLNLLARFIGDYNIVSMDLESLTNRNNRFYSSKLFKKLICMMGEVDDTVVKSTGLLKKLVSGKDPIHCEFKGKDPFDFINYAKIIMATNNLPMSADLSDAYYRRFVIIDFINKFKSNGLINKSIPQHEFENLARQLIPILVELLKNNKFENEGTLEEKKRRYEERSNPIQTFINEYCEFDPNGYIPVFEFTDNLEVYLSQRNYKKLSKKSISQFMKQTLDITSNPHRIKDADKVWRCYEGIKWKDGKKSNVTKYNIENNKFENIETLSFDNYENKVYSKEDIYNLFSSFDKEYINNKIKEMKHNGNLIEIKYNYFKFRKGVLNE